MCKKNNEKLACEHTISMLNIAEHRITIPLLAIAVLSLVQSIMVVSGEFFKGVICFLGPTQSFKTTISALFLDFKNGRKPDINFDSTEAAIIRTIGYKRDAPVIIDDLKPPVTSAMLKNLMSKLEKIIRVCSDDSGGYQRAGMYNSIITNRASCIAVITAEQLPNQAQSSLARLLVIEMNKKSVEQKALTYHQEKHNIYQAFIVNYILHISTQGVFEYSKKLTEKFLQERDVLRSFLLSRNIQVDNRTNDMIIWLYIAFNELLNYTLEVDAVNQEQHESYKKESLQIFLDLMQEQSERIHELDDVNRFFKGLRYLLDTRDAHIEHLQARNTNYIAGNSKSAIGFYKKGYVYLKNDVAFQCVVAYYRRCAKDFVLNEASLRKMLSNNGHLDPNPKNLKSFIHRLYINKESYQCIKFEEAKFYTLLKGSDTDGSEIEKEISSNWGMRQNADNILGRRT